jgi:hypothetical protein
MDTLEYLSTQVKFKPTSTFQWILNIVFFLVCVGLIIYFSIRAYTTSKNLSSPDNIRQIREQQLQILDKQWPSSIRKENINDSSVQIAQEERMLINMNVLSTRLLGYMGPFDSGVFDEDNATRIALSTGARCLVLEIGREQGGSEPLLIYRDGLGYAKSLNYGNISKVAESIAGRAFKATNEGVPVNLENDPLILVLYFTDAPSPSESPKEYIRFLSKVAKQLQPIKSRLLGNTPDGNFYRQKQESQLFYKDVSLFRGRIILLSNADTTAFRQLEQHGLRGEIDSSGDLDFIVHVRLYTKEGNSGLGITSVPSTSENPAAIITTPSYWLNIPPERLSESQAQTKRSWTLVMHNAADNSNSISNEDLKTLLQKYGVHSVPFSIFLPQTNLQTFVGKSAPFEKATWNVKLPLLRFVPPRPIPIAKPDPRTNSGGGVVRVSI